MILTVILVLHCSEDHTLLGTVSLSSDFITLFNPNSLVPAFKIIESF